MSKLYKLNFKKIKKCACDYAGPLTGVYWDKIPDDAPFMSLCKDISTKNEYPPILCINSSIEEHFTQILFILKESFTNEKHGFTGWKPFTRKYLFGVCEKDYNIYEKEWTHNGKQFVKNFPVKINEFLHTYCVVANSVE